MRNVFGKMNNEAKEFVANNAELNNLKIVEILLVNSLPLRILTRGYLTFNKPKTETIILKSTEQLKSTLESIAPDIPGITELDDYLKTMVNKT